MEYELTTRIFLERLIDRFPGTRKKPAIFTFVCFLLLFVLLEMFVQASTSCDGLFISVPPFVTPWRCYSLASRQATNKLVHLMQIRDRCTMCSSEYQPHVSAFECLSVS